MAGTSQTELRVLIDKPAKEKMEDFGEVAVNGPDSLGVDVVRIVYEDEDLDREAHGDRGVGGIPHIDPPDHGPPQFPPRE